MTTQDIQSVNAEETPKLRVSPANYRPFYRGLYYGWIALTTAIIVGLDTLIMADPYVDTYSGNFRPEDKPFVLAAGIILLLVGTRICEEAFISYYRILSRFWRLQIWFGSPIFTVCVRSFKYGLWFVMMLLPAVATMAISVTIYGIVVAF